MNDMSHLEALGSSDLRAQPIFYVENPLGLPKAPEIERQAQFIHLMRALAPRVAVFANANAGKRNGRSAMREGITAGVSDLTVAWDLQRIAFVEFKGHDAKGRAGQLSQAQIDFGNRMHRIGHDVACFFDPLAAVEWLRRKGCPIRKAEG